MHNSRFVSGDALGRVVRIHSMYENFDMLPVVRLETRAGETQRTERRTSREGENKQERGILRVLAGESGEKGTGKEKNNEFIICLQ